MLLTPTSGELLTRWTVRVALVTLVVALVCKLSFGRGYKSSFVVRLFWTLTCLLFVAHAATAFHYYHNWSHTHAYRDTARQTKELMGIEFGAGIYFSYVFLVIWLLDVMSWWYRPVQYDRRSWWLMLCIWGYLLFIVFNGAVVFEGGVTRQLGMPVCIALAGWLVLNIAGRKSGRPLRNTTNGMV